MCLLEFTNTSSVFLGLLTGRQPLVLKDSLKATFRCIHLITYSCGIRSSEPATQRHHNIQRRSSSSGHRRRNEGRDSSSGCVIPCLIFVLVVLGFIVPSIFGLMLYL